MKTIAAVFSLVSLALGISGAHAQYANVVISGEIKPGVYGRIELGNTPPPPVLYAKPVVIVQEQRSTPYKPVYLHVPPGHAKHWDKHCHKYNACNRPVYFVKSHEYDPDYRHHEEHQGDKGNGKGWAKGHGD